VTVTLQFTIPEEREELKLHQDGPAAHVVLSRLAQELRTIRKHETHTEAEHAIADRVETLLHREASEEGLEI
jgi:hypothetical protein